MTNKETRQDEIDAMISDQIYKQDQENNEQMSQSDIINLFSNTSIDLNIKDEKINSKISKSDIDEEDTSFSQDDIDALFGK